MLGEKESVKMSLCPRGLVSIALFSLQLFLFLTCCSSAGPLYGQAINQLPATDSIPCGHFSDVFLRPQDISAERSPTRITLMAARWSTLQVSAAGFQKTGVRLVGWDGGHLVPTQYKDDSGLDYYVPQFASFLHLSLADATDLFIFGVVMLSSAIGLAGLMLVLKGRGLKVWAVCEVALLAVLSVGIGDVYAIQSAVVILTVPWVLYFSRDWEGGSRFSFFFVVGVLAGVANFVRSQAGTTVLVFCFLLLGLYGKGSSRRRILLLSCLLAGVAASTLYYRHAFVVRDAYIQNHDSAYRPPAPRQHPLWHSVYIGLGFVSNPYVPGGYCDQVGMNAVQKASATTSFFSPEYDRVLGQQVYKLATSHPYVVLVNVAAKLGILQLTALLAGNIGLLAAICYPKPRSLEGAFLMATGVGAVQGLLVIPNTKYVLGGVAMLVLYGLVSINHALEQGGVRRLSMALHSGTRPTIDKG